MTSQSEADRPAGSAEAGDGCAEYLERIVYFLDNELDQADCQQVQLHLDECAPCLRKYDLERTVKAVVARSCSEAAPSGLAERVRMQIRTVQVQITDG
ncbi:mycothiol system anti-sigma-R factor [uncultured Nocardioides sp.]|uniref:mycothiol system anti-sigma-R factor n=1 Tax=uncultured Nocardioides sp. TaxID=198441 RepID=UPI00261B9A00|nr:mycothiol system anti-sigma-R factor [uncultured Nocardioides sp.]